MNNKWLEVEVFIRVAESGSFTKAAQGLNLSQPSTSRIVTELENRLGSKLLLRSTRNVTLTDSGKEFLSRARHAVAELNEAEDAVRQIDSLIGTIRIGTSIVFGTKAIIPALTKFLKRYPNLKVEIKMDDERQNLIAAGLDLSIRMGHLEDSAFGATQIASVERMLVASPDYISEFGTPRTPDDLMKHEIINHDTGDNTIKLHSQSRSFDITVGSKIKIDAAPGVLAAAVAGLGIANVTTLMSAQDLKEGKLVQILPEYYLEPLSAFAVFPSGPRPSAKVRALVEHFKSELASL
ncbi:HTH-type transcriptional regulator DmlR [Thalassocella blandensis]|nr:HTH-type transcriptional regulator DmlR [Thalassocella blandensis]